MPVKPSATATANAVAAFSSAEPGDIFFTTGKGLVGALIRHGTSSPYGHCGVISGISRSVDGQRVLPVPAEWITHEAFPGFPPWKPGLKVRSRKSDSVAAVVRVWRTEQERAAILDMSNRMVSQGLPYSWSEISAIAAGVVLPHRLVPMADASRAVICSNHVAQCIRAGRPIDYERFFRYHPNLMWPGGVAYDLAALLWNDAHGVMSS